MGLFTFLLSVFIAVLSGVSLLRSYASIPKLQKYEKNMEKAAEWSNTAEKRLWDTRYTVGTGFVATSLSLLSAVAYMVFTVKGLGFWAIGWPIVLAGGVLYAGRYMRSFWNNKAKIPMMDVYNEAISDTVRVMGLLDGIALAWGAMAALKLLGGIIGVQL